MITNHIFTLGRQTVIIRASKLVSSARSISLGPFKCQEFRASEDLAKERYESRVNEDIHTKRSRLIYQSRKRGMLENGILLSAFADSYVNKFSPDELDLYDKLINLPTNDWDIYYWATGAKPTPPEFETSIMHKLRTYISSKVSKMNESEIPSRRQSDMRPLSSYYGKSGPNDIILPKVKSKIDLEPKFSNISTVTYHDELFDDSVKRLNSNAYIQTMTQWRKDHYKKRILRTISSPASLRSISDNENPEVFTQKIDNINLANENITSKNLCDSRHERNMKHHNFLQYLLNSNFTDNPIDYDDEAEAWAEMIWHRNYGSSDITIALTSTICQDCHHRIQCCDRGLPGYVPKQILADIYDRQDTTILCQRCKFSKTYSTSLELDIGRGEYESFISALFSKPQSLIIILVDLTDYPAGIWENLIDIVGSHHRFLVVGNKIDLLPRDGFKFIDRIEQSLRANLSKLRTNYSNLHIDDVQLISARTGFGIDGLVSKLAKYTETQMDMFLVGSNNSGKSTLFSALLQSDLSHERIGDLLGRVSKYDFTNDKQYNMLRFPIYSFEGWEIALRERRCERVSRNTGLMESSLTNNTTRRQATMPHQSMLIDHLDYPRIDSADPSSRTEVTSFIKQKSYELPNFSEDHPLKHIPEYEPLSATETRFDSSGFFHMSPSAQTKDQIHDLLTIDEHLLVFPNETLIPRKYSLRPLSSIFIGGLARLDLLTSTSTVIFTIFASKYIPVHVIATRKADQFYNNFLGTPYLGAPFGGEERLGKWPKLINSQPDFHITSSSWYEGSRDIVLSSTGWALVNLAPDQECIIRAYTPQGRGISERYPPILPYAKTIARGRKVRNTPMFENHSFKSKTKSVESPSRH